MTIEPTEREERESGSRSSVRPARERPCRRWSLFSFRLVGYMCFTFDILQRSPCPNSGPATTVTGDSVRGATTRRLGGGGCRWSGLHVKDLVPGDGSFHRSVVVGFFPGGGVFSDPPPPVSAVGKGRLLWLFLRRLWCDGVRRLTKLLAVVFGALGFGCEV